MFRHAQAFYTLKIKYFPDLNGLSQLPSVLFSLPVALGFLSCDLDKSKTDRQG